MAGATTAVGLMVGTNTSKATGLVTSVTNLVADASVVLTQNTANGPIAADFATIAGTAQGVATGKGVGNPTEIAQSNGNQKVYHFKCCLKRCERCDSY